MSANRPRTEEIKTYLAKDSEERLCFLSNQYYSLAWPSQDPFMHWLAQSIGALLKYHMLDACGSSLTTTARVFSCCDGFSGNPSLLCRYHELSCCSSFHGNGRFYLWHCSQTGITLHIKINTSHADRIEHLFWCPWTEDMSLSSFIISMNTVPHYAPKHKL